MVQTATEKSKQLPGKAEYLEDVHLAALATIGLILFIFEAFLPKPVPWLKFGFANIATLLALYWYGARAAFLVTIVRILIGAVFTGNFLTPGFLLSLSGGLLAVTVMVAFYHTRLLGIWGISLAGAAAHNLGQVLAGYFIIFDNPIILQLLPYLILYSTISGSIIAIISYFLLKRLKKKFAF
jgi:heptaprenyl diphosphate synthase